MIELGLLTKLIDRLLQLVNARKQQNRDLYESLVAPIIQDMDKVHTDYIASYRKYLSMLDESDTPFDAQHKVFEEIYRDSILTRDLRARLYGLEELFKADAIGPLIEAVHGYLVPVTDEAFVYIDCNVSRDNLATGLMLIAQGSAEPSTRRNLAIKRTEQSIFELQDRYAGFLRQANLLRSKLLL